MTADQLASQAGPRDNYDHMHDHHAGSAPADLEERATRAADDLGLAILVAESATDQYEPIAVVSTTREAIAISHADAAARLARVERGEDPLCPERYALWTPDQSGAYERAITINAHEQVFERVEKRRSVQAAPQQAVAQPWSLLLTSDGFLNLAQACELRLRYVDPTRSDAVWGVDVILANGASQLIDHKDPGFEQLIELIEDQGYTIAPPRGDA